MNAHTKENRVENDDSAKLLARILLVTLRQCGIDRKPDAPPRCRKITVSEGETSIQAKLAAIH